MLSGSGSNDSLSLETTVSDSDLVCCFVAVSWLKPTGGLFLNKNDFILVNIGHGYVIV